MGDHLDLAQDGHLMGASSWLALVGAIFGILACLLAAYLLLICAFMTWGDS